MLEIMYPLQPDPLIEALESVVGDRNSLDGRLEGAVQPDVEVLDPPPDTRTI